MRAFFSQPNVLSREQLLYIDNLGKSISANYHTGNYTDRGQSLGLSTEKDIPNDMMIEIYDMVKGALEKELGIMYPTYGVFSNSVMPMAEHIDLDPSHSDYNKSPAYTIFIPLQSDFLGTSIVWNVVKKDLTKTLLNNMDVLEDPNYTYSQEEQDTSSHCTDMVSGTVGKPYVFKNTLGNILCWNRKYVHASGNSQNYDYQLDTRTMKPELNVLDNGDGSFKSLNRIVKKFALILTRWDR